MIRKDYLQEVNDWKNYEYLKFKNINDFPIPNLLYKKEKFNTSSKNAIVYCIFNHIGYLKLGFLSLLTQVVHTDITDYNIYFICDVNLYWLVRELVGEIIPVENILISPVRQKYYIFHMPEIQALDKIILMDSDGFMMGDTKLDIYKTLFSKTKPLFGQDRRPSESVIKTRLPKESDNPVNKFFDVEFLLKKISGKFWGFCGISLHHIKDIDLENIPSLLWENEYICDETVLINNYAKKGIEYDYVNKYLRHVYGFGTTFLVALNNIEIDNREEVSFLHPIMFEINDQLSEDIDRMFRIIIYKYRKYLI